MMTHSMKLTCIAALTLLGACGGGSGDSGATGRGDMVVDPIVPFAAGAVTANANGSYTILQGDETIELPASNVFFNGQTAWQTGFNGGVDDADSFISDDVIAIGGVTGDDTVFSGITGTLGDAPTGDATFDGRYAVNNVSGAGQTGALSLAFDLAASTLTSTSGSTFVVVGEVTSSGAISGTIAFGGETADFEGGFYGANDVAGAFNNTTIGGVFFGTN